MPAGGVEVVAFEGDGGEAGVTHSGGGEGRRPRNRGLLDDPPVGPLRGGEVAPGELDLAPVEVGPCRQRRLTRRRAETVGLQQVPLRRVEMPRLPLGASHVAPGDGDQCHLAVAGQRNGGVEEGEGPAVVAGEPVAIARFRASAARGWRGC